MPLTHIEEGGRVAIPATILRMVGLKEGAKLEVTVEDNQIVLTPVGDTVRPGLHEFAEEFMSEHKEAFDKLADL